MHNTQTELNGGGALAVYSKIAFTDSSTEATWTRTSILYATSASLLASLVPYTFLLGEPINQELEKHERNLAQQSEGSLEDDTVHQLVDRWATINLGRAAISAVSALLATWAAVDRLEVVPATLKFATGANRLG